MSLEDYLEKHYSSTAIKGYAHMIRRFKRTLGADANQAGYMEILDYIGMLRGQQLHPKTLRNNLFAIKIYFNYLLAIKKRNDHPCRYLYLKDQINRQIAIEDLYPKKVLEELYANYQARRSEDQKRDKIIISLLIYQALTTLEIRQLRVKEVDLRAGIIRIKANKKNKGRVLSLKPNQILLFDEYEKKDRKRYWKKQKRGKRCDHFILSAAGLPLWKSGINRMINRGRAKEDRLTAMKIRQSVIANLLKEKNDVRIVQEFAGHRSTSSTEAYRQTGLEELKQAIEQKHPLQ